MTTKIERFTADELRILKSKGITSCIVKADVGGSVGHLLVWTTIQDLLDGMMMRDDDDAYVEGVVLTFQSASHLNLVR